MSKKSHIVLVADERGWIFERHCQEIKKRLSNEFDFTIAYRRNNFFNIAHNCDIVYVLDPMALGSWPPPNQTIMGLRCEFMYQKHPNGPRGLYEQGLSGWGSSIRDRCSLFHVVNKRQYEAFKDIVTDKPFLLVQHGVDEECFDRSKYSAKKNEVLTVSISGRNSRNKGFNAVRKICEQLGIRIASAEYGGQKRTKEQMPDFYNSVDVHVCMSASEGLNNAILEAGAMGVPVISTRCGASEEMIVDGESGLLIDRTEEALAAALNRMKNEKERIRMGENFHGEITRHWTWKVRIDDFRRMFNLALEK